MVNCGLRNDEQIKTEFHYDIGRYTWYRQDSDHWVEPSECTYVQQFETWLLVEVDYRETDVGERGVKAALALASEVLEQRRNVHDAALDSKVRRARKKRAINGTGDC